MNQHLKKQFSAAFEGTQSSYIDVALMYFFPIKEKKKLHSLNVTFTAGEKIIKRQKREFTEKCCDKKKLSIILGSFQKIKKSYFHYSPIF